MMGVFLRVIAILVEVLILGAIIGVMVFGARLTFFDLGLRPKYKKMVDVTLVILGSIIVVFFIVHLTTFYPPVGTG